MTTITPRAGGPAISAPRVTNPAPWLRGDGIASDAYAAVASNAVAQRKICTTRDLDNDEIVQATVATSYPAGSNASWFAIESGKKTGRRYGAAVEKGASFEAGGSDYVESTFGATYAPSKKDRSYRVSVIYAEVMTTCSSLGGSVTYVSRIPVGETGRVYDIHGIDRPDWDRGPYCTGPVASLSFWHRDTVEGRSYTLGTGVKISGLLGFDLGVERGYSSSQRLTYEVNKRNKFQFCGNNDYAASAGKVLQDKL